MGTSASASEGWDRRTIEALADAYLARGPGPGGSGSGSDDPALWRAKRWHLSIPMDRDGHWLDVGCANGHLLATLPVWCAERGVTIEANGLELIPELADAARRYHPALADRIHTGSVLTWSPPRRYDYVTVLDDQVPPDQLGRLVDHAVSTLVKPGGRLIVSCYTNRDTEPRPLVDNLLAAGHRPDGTIHIDRPGAHPLQTAWIDVAGH